MQQGSTEVIEQIRQIALINGQSIDEVANTLSSLARAGKLDEVGVDKNTEFQLRGNKL